ncbi:hypothetical protein VNI00_007473 [Paramarasmius palmivorus]|uniref:Uncharacterized protein n=1 Tax=Paramarasmius palmivorus TaxID=297713 RepID=A0AAW0D3L9_9AGAR
MIAFLPVALGFFLALAGRVIAQDDPAKPPPTINATVGNQLFLANQFLSFDFTNSLAECSTNCTSARGTIDQAGGSLTTLCSNETAKALLDCQQCLYTALIKANKPLPDLRAGSTPLLQGYSQSCTQVANVNLTKEQTSLVLPPFWDGPNGIGIPMIGLPFAIGFATIFGTGAIVMLSTM